MRLSLSDLQKCVLQLFSNNQSVLGKSIASSMVLFFMCSCQNLNTKDLKEKAEIFELVESKLMVENLQKKSKNYLTAEIYKDSKNNSYIFLTGPMGIQVASIATNPDKGILALHRRKECHNFSNHISIFIDDEVGAIDFERTFINRIIEKSENEKVLGSNRVVELADRQYHLTWLIPLVWTKVWKNRSQLQFSCPPGYKKK